MVLAVDVAFLARLGLFSSIPGLSQIEASLPWVEADLMAKRTHQELGRLDKHFLFLVINEQENHNSPLPLELALSKRSPVSWVRQRMRSVLANYRQNRITKHFTNLKKGYIARLQWLTFADCLRHIDALARLTETRDEYWRMKNRITMQQQWRSFASRLALDFTREAADHLHSEYRKLRTRITVNRANKWRQLARRLSIQSDTAMLRRGKLRCRWLGLRDRLLAMSFIEVYSEHGKMRSAWISLASRYMRQNKHTALVRGRERRTRERRSRAASWSYLARSLRNHRFDELRKKWEVFAKRFRSSKKEVSSEVMGTEDASSSYNITESDEEDLNERIHGRLVF